MPKASQLQNINIKVYHGYGHKHNMMLYGHTLQGKPIIRKYYGNNLFKNLYQLLRIFFVKPVGGIALTLSWGNQVLKTVSEKDGYFKFQWESETDVPAGWHTAMVTLRDNPCTSTEASVVVPHISQYAFISDIDDTVLISHSAATFQKLRVLFTKNPRTRKAFADVVQHYQMLAHAYAEPNVTNPFFYVSSSEWNLYNELLEFFSFNKLPSGVFLLSGLKRWYQLFKTGGTKHHGKLVRIARVLEVYPKQRFVLFGDNSQQDPQIYAAIAAKHPQQIKAIYIRNIKASKKAATVATLTPLKALGVQICLFDCDEDAIAFSQQIQLIPEAILPV